MLDSSGPQSTSSHGSGSEDSVTSLMARGGGGLETGGSTDTPSVKKSARIQDVLRSELGTAQDENRKRKGVSIGQGSPEIIDSLLVVNQYKERLARDIACRELAARPPHSAAGKKRVSPIQERLPLSPSSGSASSSDIPTASIESNKTGRGGSTTAFTPGLAGRTPSYSFLRMATPGHGPSALRGTFTHGTPGGIFNAAGAQCDSVIHDQLRSDPFTPAPIMTFQPRGSSPLMDRDFPTPNLYELVLMLGAEPGLDAWWCTVVQIMKEHYRAERVTLSVSADATDLESVPWAQKATYNPTEEDEYSMGYMGRSSMFLSSMDVSETASNLDGSQRSDMPLRPGTQSHHYFTSYENKESTAAQSTESPSTTPQRPTAVPRSNSSFPAGEKRVPSSPRPSLNKQALEEHDAVEQRQPILSWGAPVGSRPKAKGRVLPVLQELELEADPLIDHNGIKGVIERDRVIALTRSYPYLDPAFDEKSKKKSNRPNPTRIHSSAKLSSFLATATDARPPSQSTTATGGDRISKRSNLLTVLDDEEPRPPTRKYEEYKQAPPSPWSQFPTHSPTVQVDPSEIPFFTDAMVDEDSFNPGRSPIDYTNSQPPKTIGVDNSWTVLHIPFKHILLSKPARTFNLKSAALAQKTASRGLADTTAVWGFSEPPSRSDLLEDSRHYPIAILSILSPLIPYPSNLRYSVEHLASHLATSFSLCQHYSDLETKVSGLQRKRPATAGFGALGLAGRPFAGPVLYAQMKYTPSEHPWQQSIAGSMTSPSEASGATRSAAHSPEGSIERDPNSFGLVVEKRTTSTSLGMVGGGGYFAAAAQSVAASQDVAPGTPGYRPGRGSEDTPPSLKTPNGQTGSGQSIQPSTPAGVDFGSALHIPHERTFPYPAQEQAALEEIGQALLGPNNGQSSQRHTKLHSYGADFATTFQSLPSGSWVNQIPAREDKLSILPPSDRLQGLMLDSLPVHVFVAWPTTGEIMWVNGRYLSYRGQTVADLILDPWGSVHPKDRDDYIQKWSHSLRTGEQFAYTVRLRRFDGVYRWHQTRAVASKDKRAITVYFIGSYMDIHDQKVAELMAARQEEIEASEAKHRLLANLIPQIIFAATEEHGIIFTNEQWLSYTGQSFEDSLGLGFIDFVHPQDLAKCRISSERSGSGSSFSLPSADLSELVKKGIIKVVTDSTGRLSYTTELRLKSKLGEYRWHLVRCVETNNINFGTGECSYFGSATDINDHKLLEAQLKEAMESKALFLSNMSHEIRTPLIGISGMASFLQDTVLNEEQRDYTNTIQTSANSLLMIINDILDLSKVDAGMMKLNFEWFHTRSLIEEVNELVFTMAITKRLELNYVVEQDVPLWVKGDKTRIRQVLLNVIGNAIKFTSQGEVFSRCKVTQRQEQGDHTMLEFSVVDTGRGFTKEESELIFKPFSQIDGSSTRQHGGSGLGLVISRQLVELHGGKMDGTAVPGKGSIFTFTVKLGLPTATDHPSLPITPPVAPLTQATSEESSAAASMVRPFSMQKVADSPSISSPSSDASVVSQTLTSSASSDPSVRSTRSSMSSLNNGFVHFSEAAQASGQDLSQMKLEMPLGALAPCDTPTPDFLKADQSITPMHSILIICPWTFSREATTKHIELTLPKDVPHRITALGTVEEAWKLIGRLEAVTFTYIVLNLPSAEEVTNMVDQVTSSSGGKTSVLVLSDSVQRQAVLKLTSDNDHLKLLAQKLVTFICKPVKPSRFAAVFDPAKLRDLSIDRNRLTAAQMVEFQKQSYIDLEKRIGNKGYKVLLVEDNPINQKVLVRYLKKVGIVAEIANDGVECTEKVFSHRPGFYSLVFCDLHMPRKDGYQACRDIRQWEKKNKYSRLPIIALTADVMSDVQEKCLQADFSDYVTKPFDFTDLSTATSKFI